MTALCGGGTSSAIEGDAQQIALTTNITSLLLSLAGRSWLSFLVALLPTFVFDPASDCTTDPPADIAITPDDALAILSFDPVGTAAAFNKLRQIIRRLAWFRYCRCDSGPQPAFPAPIPAPTGWPDLTGLYQNAPRTACQRFDGGTIHMNTFAPGPNTHTYFGTEDCMFTGNRTFPRLATWTHYRIQFRVTPTTDPSPPTESATASIAFYNSACSGTVTPFFNQTHNFTGITDVWSVDSGIVPLPSGAGHIQPVMSISGHPWEADVTMSLEFFCGDPNQVGSPCAPDPAVLGLLNQILSLVTLTQRQIAPFAYIRSTTHAGLTGDGHFAVQGLIGALITITDFGTNVGMQDGDPLVLFDAGWINWGTDDGSSPRERISASPQMSLPADCGQYTRISYSLPPGVEITIVELVRES